MDFASAVRLRSVKSLCRRHNIWIDACQTVTFELHALGKFWPYKGFGVKKVILELRTRWTVMFHRLVSSFAFTPLSSEILLPLKIGFLANILRVFRYFISNIHRSFLSYSFFLSTCWKALRSIKCNIRVHFMSLWLAWRAWRNPGRIALSPVTPRLILKSWWLWPCRSLPLKQPITGNQCHCLFKRYPTPSHPSPLYCRRPIERS